MWKFGSGIHVAPALLLLLTGVRSGANGIPPALFLNLASPEFRQREAAQAELLAWARLHRKEATDSFLNQFHTNGDPEVRNRSLDILRDLVCDSYFEDGPGYIGISMRDELIQDPGDTQPSGAIRVVQVQAGTPGDLAGLKAGDLIVEANGAGWAAMEASVTLSAIIKQDKPMTKVLLKVLRDGGPKEVIVTLGRRPLAADRGNNFDFQTGEKISKDAYFKSWLDAKSGRG